MDDLTTPRLRATRLSPEDLADLVELHLDGNVSQFIGGIRTPAATVAYLEGCMRHWIDNGFGILALRTEDGAFVGRAGLRRIEIEGVLELELAYTLASASWGNGYATEISRALLKIWCTQFAEQSLIGVVMKGNQRSENVLLKLGFTHERDAIYFDEVCGVFRLLR